VRDLDSILNEKNRAQTMRKPFDLLAEGLLRKDSRGDWTPLELFIAALWAWPASIRRLLVAA
jgi:hypothetical protein